MRSEVGLRLCLATELPGDGDAGQWSTLCRAKLLAGFLLALVGQGILLFSWSRVQVFEAGNLWLLHWALAMWQD